MRRKEKSFYTARPQKILRIRNITTSIHWVVLLAMHDVVTNRKSQSTQFAGLEDRTFISRLWLLPTTVQTNAKFFHSDRNIQEKSYTVHAVTFSGGLIVFKKSEPDNKLEQSLMFRTSTSGQDPDLVEKKVEEATNINYPTQDPLDLQEIDLSDKGIQGESYLPKNVTCEKIRQNYLRLAYRDNDVGPDSFLTDLYRWKVEKGPRFDLYASGECDKGNVIRLLNGARIEAKRIAPVEGVKNHEVNRNMRI